ncbi:helix-turn-helix domain-containing protein [Streptomyces sp. NBC_01498]|uniref:helix-turn-helix domain-containing protein n=1 Tax=Streptomyces sp. NBC_01498 TaxID=2975870 RepID=UPI002E7BA985|nr:GAF domain-containing protein [Streptomyces sp. NBC_01498]WTL28174.1 helix-turn-helix domain-containing protein [Streptomyces sp. NBC_01498]
MLADVTAPGTRHATTALRRLLDLLARGAPAEEFSRPAADARAAGVRGGELAALTDATEVALRIRRTLSQHRRREAQLTALFDTASDLAALRDLDAVLRAIVHRAKLLLGTDVTYLSLNDEAAGDTYMRVTDGSVAAAFQQVRLGMGEGLGGLVAQSARPYATGDYQRDTRFHHTGTIDSAVRDEGLRAILGVPLRVGARVIGVLYAADRAPREFAAEEVALLSSLADHAAIAIDGARLLEETRAALVDLNAASETIRAHSAEIRRAEEAHDQLTDLVLRGGGPQDVAAALADILDGGILIHDADGAELARARTGSVPPPAPAVAASRAGGRAVPLDGTWVCAVVAGPELLGSIALTGHARLPDVERLLFERAGVVTALLLLLRRSVAEAEDRVRGELLGDLLSRSGDPGALTARARRLGVDLARRHCVFVADSETADRHRLLAVAARHAQADKGLAGLHQGHVVLVAPGEAPGPDARRLAAELGQAVGAPVTVGAAGPAAGPAELPTAHGEAGRCLSALRVLGRTGHGGAAGDLGFVGVLLGDRADLGGYVRATLGPVLDYDAERGTDLVGTLGAYFAEGASLTRTKSALHVHVNTVVQRLERVGRLLGDDWNSPARALEIQLALRLHGLTDGPHTTTPAGRTEARPAGDRPAVS